MRSRVLGEVYVGHACWRGKFPFRLVQHIGDLWEWVQIFRLLLAAPPHALSRGVQKLAVDRPSTELLSKTQGRTRPSWERDVLF